MNKRMTEACTTLRSYLTMTTYTLSAEQHKAACSALDVIEAALDEYADADDVARLEAKPLPLVVRKLTRAESDYAAAKRAEFVTIDETGLMTPEQCEAAKLRGAKRAHGMTKVIARVADEAADKRRFQQFADALVHGDPYHSERKAEAEATVARASTILGPYSFRCGLQQFKDALRHIDPVELDEEPLSPESTAALAAGLESARRGEIQALGSFAQYVDLEEEPHIRMQDCATCGHLYSTDCAACRAETNESFTARLNKGVTVQEPAARCCVCSKPRGDVCGHDVDDGHGRRWYCSRECASK